MGYAKEFNHEEYTIPEFLLKNSDWEDVSWHNDMCPRWENYKLMLAVWVNCADPALREFEDCKQYMVCQVLKQGTDDYHLADGDLFSTDDINQLQEWLATYGGLQYAEKAVECLNLAITPFVDVQDELATVIAMLREELRLLK